MLSVPSKVILFGEYALLKGGNALGVPLSNFTGMLSDVQSGSEFALNSQSNLKRFCSWIKNQPALHEFIHVQKLIASVENGLWFDSRIPLNSGLGSSGALVSAILHEFKTPKLDTLTLSGLKKILAEFERFFHGTSSGIDPLLSYLNQPILIKADGEVHPLKNSFTENKGGVITFLTPIRGVGKTSDLVGIFHKKWNYKAYLEGFKSEYLPVNNLIIETFLSGQESDFWDVLWNLSSLQLTYFPEMIDADLEALFKEGISSRRFGLKLCGSGGGGFALGFAKSAQDIHALFKDAILLRY